MYPVLRSMTSSKSPGGALLTGHALCDSYTSKGRIPGLSMEASSISRAPLVV